MEREILEIAVTVDGVTEVAGAAGTVRMIMFGGTASGEFFSGRVMPCAVDTQIDSGGFTTLSARYILDGRDADGHKCRIFVENNGTNKNGTISTKPKILTDSPVFKRFEAANLSGTVVTENDCLIVKIFEITE